MLILNCSESLILAELAWVDLICVLYDFTATFLCSAVVFVIIIKLFILFQQLPSFLQHYI